GADVVELALHAPHAGPQRRDVELVLELAAAEHRVALGVEGEPVSVLRIAVAARVDRVAAQDVLQLPEDESVEARVVGGQLETKGPGGAAGGGLDRVWGFDGEVGIADVERRGRVMGAAG